MKRKVLFVLIFTLTIGLTAAIAQQVNYKFSGYVYEGGCDTIPPTASPLYDVVLVRLYGSYNSGDLGTLLVTTTTSSDGSYGLPMSIRPDGKPYEYYTIVCEGKSGYYYVCCRSIGGSAMYEQIRYTWSLQGKTLTDNNFWYMSEEQVGDCIIKVYKFHDKDGDCVLDTDEEGLGDWKICLDENQNCQCDPDEPFKITDAGGWTFFDNLACQATYYLAEELKPGWERTCPNSPPCQVSINTTRPDEVHLVHFGNRRTVGRYDFGDAPDSYSTLQASGGPYHDVNPLLCLGTTVDVDPDGQPDPDALGDDNDGSDDEDGVTFPANLVVGQPATVNVEVNNSGTVDVNVTVMGWIDFGGDGNFEPIADRIGNQNVLAPAMTVTTVPFSFTVPPSANAGPTFARFRLRHVDTEPGTVDTVVLVLSPQGYGYEGEVEDYEVQIEGEGGECTINVYKWEDKNGNCVWEEDEQGLGKWKICLDYNQNCQCDPNEPFTYTDATGHGWFDNLACGATYYLAEELKPGWERTCPNTPPCQVEIHTAPPTVTQQVISVVWFGNRRVGRYDFGDAPDSYATLHASGGPYHDVNPLLCLGTTVDVDSDGQPDPHALGDDNGGSDDEDGVTFLTNLVAGDLAKVSLAVRNDGATVADVTVVGWIDFNGNGNFEPLVELIGHQNVLASPMTVTPVEFSFTVPPGAALGQTFARFRLYREIDPQPGIAYIVAPTGYGFEGEVEDYEVEITSEDGGCLIKVYKWYDKDGDCVLDADEMGLPDWKICLDYNHNCQCDPNEPFKITDAGGWAFFDNLACNTTYYLAEELKPGWQRTCPAPPPCQVTVHTTKPSDVQIIWFGNRLLLLEGEYDFGDAPEPYPTKLFSGGAFHFLGVGPIGVIFPWLGPTVDPDPDGQPDPLAQGDDSDADGDDEDGVIGGPFVQGIPVALSVTVSTMPGVLEAWIDWNGNKIWEHPAEQVYAGLLSVGTHDIYVTAPFGCVERPFGRFRISSQGGLSPTGYARDGEVEDRQFGVLAVDWGDAPISYPTLGIHGGASHTFMPSSPEAFMGVAIDGEIDGQPHPDALGDDVDPDGDDEDGVTFLTMPLVAGQQGKVRVVLNGSGFFTVDLSAWIDFNQDNDWDEPDDMILFQSLPVGTHDLTFNVPPGAKPGVTYARFRSRVAIWPTPPSIPTGHEFFTGEVEDYEVRVVEEGDPNGPPEELPHVKWSQPPIEIDPNLSPQTRRPITFCGWDESAISTAIQQPRNWVMVADDFRCLGPIPITRIRWWGSYENWQSTKLPDILPTKWQINFWSNVPKHVVTNFSFPEKLLWQIEVPFEKAMSWAVSFDNCPNKPSDLCFEYNLELEPEQWFWQNNFETQDNTFWISITAIYSDGVRVPNIWGWKSRPEAWMDLAVRFALQGDGLNLGLVLDPSQIVPLEQQIICNEVQDFDMSFELLTEEPWVKCNQSFTSIHDWPHYEDEVSMGTEDQTGKITVSRLVADDWLCDQLNPVVAVAWNGSYIGYGYEACQCHESTEPYRPDYFLLSIWTNASADSEVPFDHPGNKVWEYKALEYNEVQVGFDKHPEGEPSEPVFRYSVRLPEDNWFQQDTLNQTYWFSVVAIYEEPADNVPYRWGWTNHYHVYKSNAVAKSSGTYEQLYDQEEKPADMSFMLFNSVPDEF